MFFEVVLTIMTYISSHTFCHALFYGISEFMYQQNEGVKSPNMANN